MVGRAAEGSPRRVREGRRTRALFILWLVGVFVLPAALAAVGFPTRWADLMISAVVLMTVTVLVGSALHTTFSVTQAAGTSASSSPDVE